VSEGAHENKVIFKLNSLPLIIIFQVDLTLVVKLCMDGCLKESLPKVELKKFDGIEVFTWVHHI